MYGTNSSTWRGKEAGITQLLPLKVLGQATSPHDRTSRLLYINKNDYPLVEISRIDGHTLVLGGTVQVNLKFEIGRFGLIVTRVIGSENTCALHVISACINELPLGSCITAVPSSCCRLVLNSRTCPPPSVTNNVMRVKNKVIRPPFVKNNRIH